MTLWAWIFTGIGLVALVTWVALLSRLVRPAKSLISDLVEMGAKAEAMREQLENRDAIEHPRNNLKDSPAELLAQRAAWQAARAKRERDRQRRLVARVKKIKVEGRFKNV